VIWDALQNDLPPLVGPLARLLPPADVSLTPLNLGCIEDARFNAEMDSDLGNPQAP